MIFVKYLLVNGAVIQDAILLQKPSEVAAFVDLIEQSGFFCRFAYKLCMSRAVLAT